MRNRSGDEKLRQEAEVQLFFSAKPKCLLTCTVVRSRNAQWGNDSYRGPRMGACTEATLAPHAAILFSQPWSLANHSSARRRGGAMGMAEKVLLNTPHVLSALSPANSRYSRPRSRPLRASGRLLRLAAEGDLVAPWRCSCTSRT